MVKEVFVFLEKREKLSLLVILGLSIVVAFVELVGVISIFGILEIFAFSDEENLPPSYAKIMNYIGMESERNFKISFAGFVAFMALVRCAVVIVHSWVTNRFLNQINVRIALKLYNRYLTEHSHRLFSEHSSDYLKNIITESGCIAELVSLGVHIFVTCMVITVICGAIFIKQGIDTFFAFGFIMLVYLAIHRFFGPIMKRMGNIKVQLNTQRFRELSEGLSIYKEIQIYDRKKFFVETVQSTFSKFFRNHLHQKVFAIVPRNIIEASVTISLVLYITLTFYNNDNMREVVADLTLFAIVFFRVMPRVDTTSQKILKTKIIAESFHIVKKDLYPAVELKYPPSTESIEFQQKLSLSDVQYSFPSSEAPILKNINFEIVKGKRVAVFGESGSGKSTLINLLTGFLEPDSGSYKIDDRPVDGASLAGVRKLMSYVPQRAGLLHDTLIANIALGQEQARINFDLVLKISKIVGLDNKVSELPEGFNTPIGQDGDLLSGGYRQKVGIARALYKQPSILFLDEATSSLDKKSETQLLKNLLTELPDLTVIFVCHRHEAIKNFDTFLFVRDGHVVTFSDYKSVMKQVTK